MSRPRDTGYRSALVPWVDDLDPSFPEVGHVAGGQRRPTHPADSRDLRIKPLDRHTQPFPMAHDQPILTRRSRIKGQHLISEGPEHLSGRRPQLLLPPPWGEPLDAVQDLRHRDR